MTIFEILSLIFILFTMGASLGNLWLNLKKQKSTEKIDLSKLELDLFKLKSKHFKIYSNLIIKWWVGGFS